MSDIKVLCDRADLVSIADGIREKTGSSATYTLSGIAEIINHLSNNKMAVLRLFQPDSVLSSNNCKMWYTDYNGELQSIEYQATTREYVDVYPICNSIVYFDTSTGSIFDDSTYAQTPDNATYISKTAIFITGNVTLEVMESGSVPT